MPETAEREGAPQKLPAGHGVHDARPADAWKVPGEQLVQATAPVADLVPGAQNPLAACKNGTTKTVNYGSR